MANDLELPPPERASALYREHARALRAFVGARVSDAAAVEDVLQETFLAAIARGLPPGEEGRWLFAIARNKTRRHARDREETASPDAIEDARPSGPFAGLDEEEERARVRAAVARLDHDLREVILLRYEGGLDYRAIADRLAVPPTTVQGRLKRAREALKSALAPRERERSEVRP